jgi:hypothetical protein
MSSLEQDYNCLPGQVFALISLVGPELPQKNEKFGLKIRGVFASRDDANTYAKKLQKDDATFDINVVDMYKWLLIPPDRDKIDDVHYAEEKLEEIMTKYHENQSQARTMFEKRKKDMVEKSSYMDPSDENSKYYTRPDEPPISHPSEIVEKLKVEHPDKKMDELIEMANDVIAQEMKDRQAWRDSRASGSTQLDA